MKFKNSTTIVSEIETQQQVLADLESTSAAHLSFIESTIAELEETSKKIDAEKAKTVQLIQKLTATSEGLTLLKDSNTTKIRQLKDIFSVEEN